MPTTLKKAPIARQRSASPAVDQQSTVSVALDVAAMRGQAGEATALLRALANSDRLLLLCQLVQGERSVSELESLLDIRQPTLSQQLGVLRNEALVMTRREGKQIFYSVADAKVRTVLQTLYGLFCGTKKGVK